jgi:arsenate reductase-like glutaredoxin family protein
MRDVVQEPLSEEEFAKIIVDRDGHPRVPFTMVGKDAVLGFDPIRFREYYDASPNAPVIAHVRKGDASCDQLLAYLRAEGIPHALRDVDEDPLSIEELWRLLTIPGRNVKTPYTVVGDELVLGYDIPKLERVLGLVNA